MSKTSWIIFVIVIFGILAALIVFSDSNKLDVSKIDTNAVQKANEQNGNIGDHVFGKSGSKVTLIEYSDFQCPYCGNMHSIIQPITEKYKEQLLYIFRNFPIPESHPNAKAAAASAEAAGLQGKYWEMHNKIFTTQSDWSNLSVESRSEFFENLASEFGLDIAKFNADLAGTTSSTSINMKVSFDSALANKAGVNGTPTLFLNGNKLDLSKLSDEEKFKKIIDTELKKAGIPLPK